jgi:Fe-S-cluster-containing dehydrogenase component/CRP-like cAMP-binding protein
MFGDRWSAFGENPDLLELSDRLSPAEMREIELFASYDDATLEELSPDVARARWKTGVVLFEEGTYIDLAFFVVQGEVEVGLTRVKRSVPLEATFAPGRTAGVELAAPAAGGTRLLEIREKTRAVPERIALLTALDVELSAGDTARLGPGEVFGEIGALSGWPQSATARTRTECTLVQIRLPALQAMRKKTPAFKARLDAVYRERSLTALLSGTPVFRGCSPGTIEELRRGVELVSFSPGDEIAVTGNDVDAAYLVRSGFVRLAQPVGVGEIAASYLSKGMTLGDVELVAAEATRWEATATSVEYTELVKIPRELFLTVLRREPEARKRLWQSGIDRANEYNFSRRSPDFPALIDTALDRGFVQANALLAIDLELCTRCDDCVRACAATHEGTPRFVREGTRFENLLIAKSCYHCNDPVCLVGCPTGAIHRSGRGVVVEIDESICIGCTRCASNCPYDAIVMLETGAKWAENAVPTSLRGRDRKLASKCDLCAPLGHDPACVTNCPQACAFRVGSLDELQSLVRSRS